MESRIKFEGVDKYFQDVQVLKEVSFEIGKGEIFGLLGPSGAGKTTIINILAGQIAKNGGEVYIEGIPSGQLNRKVYQDFGVMLDNPGLYERLSCYDNLLLFARIYKIPRQKIDDALEQVGLLEAKKRPAGKLSKGMKQRLVLARAILHQPRVLLLDEPTGALDPATALQIHRLIKEQRDRGASILLTTHNMEEAQKLCDHIALLNQGEIIESGVPDVICRKYNHQNQIQILLKGGQLVQLPAGRESADQIKAYFVAEKVSSIHSSEPNLESVFMELTGKGLEG